MIKQKKSRENPNQVVLVHDIIIMAFFSLNWQEYPIKIDIFKERYWNNGEYLPDPLGPTMVLTCGERSAMVTWSLYLMWGGEFGNWREKNVERGRVEKGEESWMYLWTWWWSTWSEGENKSARERKCAGEGDEQINNYISVIQIKFVQAHLSEGKHWIKYIVDIPCHDDHHIMIDKNKIYFPPFLLFLLRFEPVKRNRTDMHLW